MKRIVVLLCVVLTLTSCATGVQPPKKESGTSLSAFSAELAESSSLAPVPMAYKPSKKLTAHQTIEAYIEQQYESYIQMKYIDLSSILDLEDNINNQNMARWTKMLAQRRRLLSQNNICYVETEKFPYNITFDDTATDRRMTEWQSWINYYGYTPVHFRITGKAGKAYPPIMAINSQHTIFLKKIDGKWKIMLHYFPGSMRKFTAVGTIRVPSEEAMLAKMKKEFARYTSPETPELPVGAKAYDPKKAVTYAKNFCEKKNDQFVHIGDWTGNCANFTSQCVWAGFGGGNSMSSQWSANSHSATTAWVHVNTFWNYITSAQALKGQRLGGIRAAEPGDIIQIRSATKTNESQRFTHTLILVDAEKLTFAQNTPSSFVYYSDMVDLETRFIRPTSFTN